MNDATDPVGAGGWAAPDGPPHPADPVEVEFDGRRWEVPRAALAPPPGWLPPVGDFEPPDGAFAFDGPESGEAGEADGPEDEAERSARLEAAHAELARDIEGWSPEMAADLAAYAQSKGFSPEELAAVEDPREVKVLHLAMLGEQALAAQAHERAFGRFRPPTTVGGRGHPGHLPEDRQSTDAWMQARSAQLRKKARR